MKQKIFSVTIDDCRVDTFRGSGNGGQNRNKRDTGVRITHQESGAVGHATEHRTQLQNKQAAFRRMAESKEMTAWLKLETARRAGWNIEEEVTKELESKNLKIEVKDEQGRWVNESVS